MDFKRITVITGHYGSGKTEVSINYAIHLAQKGLKTAIVDLDIVNPYFRSREAGDRLKEYGIKVVCTNQRYLYADLPALSPEIYGVLQNKEYYAVFDVGGDDVGATALGRYNKYFKEEDYEMLFVVNVNRPFTKDKESVIRYMREIEAASRLKVTHLVNNTHLLKETTVEDLLKGQKVVEEVSRELGIPVKLITAQKEILDKLPEGLKGEKFPLNLFMTLPWR